MVQTGSNFPKVRVEGGPHGRNLKLTVDGEELKGVHRAELIFDVHDVVRIKTSQFVEAIVEIEEAKLVPSARVKVIRPSLEGAAYEVLAESAADTVWEALYDCARQIELAARGVAQSGTIGESSGRPPGH